MKSKSKKPKWQIADVPDPAVPNRAHTEMRISNSNGSDKEKDKCDDDKCEIDFGKKRK